MALNKKPLKTMSYKIAITDKFCEKLDGFRVNYRRHNPYHVQVQIEHNFYPCKRTYYNSETGKKFKYDDFETVGELMEFLSNNVKPE